MGPIAELIRDGKKAGMMGTEKERRAWGSRGYTDHSALDINLGLPQNHNEVPLHATQDGCYPKVYKQ